MNTVEHQIRILDEHLTDKLEELVGSGGGGCGEVFTVTFSEIPDTGGELEVDKSAAEIKAAYDAGKKVVGVYSGQEFVKIDLVKAVIESYEGEEYTEAYFQGYGPLFSDSTFSGFCLFFATVYDNEAGMPVVETYKRTVS